MGNKSLQKLMDHGHWIIDGKKSSPQKLMDHGHLMMKENILLRN
jgi:hypothetical protein